MGKTKSMMMFQLDCPRCGKHGKLKVQRVNPGNPTWYGHVLHFENDGFPHGKIIKDCYIGKVQNNQIRCITTQDIINLPNFNEKISLEDELHTESNSMRVGVIEVWCDAIDCEHCNGKLCQSDTIEIKQCYNFSRKKDWKDALDADKKST